MIKFEIESLLDGGILRETPFHQKLKDLDWSVYKGQQVLIQGCSSVPIPTWAYLVVAVHLSQVADRVFYGEENRPTFVYKK
jgi:hypothetical protein